MPKIRQHILGPEYERMTISEEAARIMMEHGMRDCRLAKEKAVAHLGISSRRKMLPSNKELISALRNRLELFDGDKLSERCRHHYSLATELMNMLEPFQPRLVGYLLQGIAMPQSPIELHVFSDTLEEVQSHLPQHGINPRLYEKRMRLSLDKYKNVSGLYFQWRENQCELTVFKRQEIRQAPICPIEGKPMQRLSLSQIVHLQ